MLRLRSDSRPRKSPATGKGKANYYADPIPSFRFWSGRKNKSSSIIRAKSKQASCAEMVLGSFVFLLV